MRKINLEKWVRNNEEEAFELFQADPDAIDSIFINKDPITDGAYIRTAEHGVSLTVDQTLALVRILLDEVLECTEYVSNSDPRFIKAEWS